MAALEGDGVESGDQLEEWRVDYDGGFRILFGDALWNMVPMYIKLYQQVTQMGPKAIKSVQQWSPYRQKGSLEWSPNQRLDRCGKR